MSNKSEKRLLLSIAIIPILILTGTFGYMILEGWNFFDSLYMTMITISTTGFKEVYQMNNAGRALSMILIFGGVTVVAYIGGSVIQFLLENQMMRKRKMKKQIDQLKDHYIVCGYGKMGSFISEGLKYYNENFVIIESEQSLENNLILHEYLYFIDDASNDEVLIKAGIERAKGLVAVVSTDAENVFITLSAKGLNPNIFVVARAIDEKTESKLKKAGANRVVKPYELGGNRMIQLLLKPSVSDFIDIVVRKRGMNIKIEEIEVKTGSKLIGETLASSPIRKELDVMIIGVSEGKNDFIYNPKSSYIIKEGVKFIALGKPDDLEKLKTIYQPL